MKLKFYAVLIIGAFGSCIWFASVVGAQTVSEDPISTPVEALDVFTGADFKKISNDKIETILATTTFNDLFEKESAARSISQNEEVLKRLDQIILLLKVIAKK